MPERQIPLVMSEGTPFARGLHLGRVQIERVHQTVSAYLALFLEGDACGRAGVVGHSAR